MDLNKPNKQTARKEPTNPGEDHRRMWYFRQEVQADRQPDSNDPWENTGGQAVQVGDAAVEEVWGVDYDSGGREVFM